jgi:hypothetical protein
MPNAPKRPFHTAADADIKSGKPLIEAGRIVRDLPPPRTLRDFVLDQLRSVPLDTLRRQGLRRDF